MLAQQVNKTKQAVSYQVRLSRDCEREVMKLEVEISLLSIVDLADNFGVVYWLL